MDLVALVMVIERDGFGYTISDKLTEQLENFFNEAIFGFEDFVKKLWEKFNLAIKDFELWYLKYGDNSYYWYKILGELTPDILTIIVPELAASKAAKVLKAGTVAAEVSEEFLQKSGKVLSEKLEQTTAKKEVQEVFEKVENELDSKIPRNSILEAELNKFPVLKDKFPNESIPKDGKLFGIAEIESGLIKIDGKLVSYEDVNFIITSKGELRLGFRHVFLAKNADIIAAGGLKIDKGIVKKISNLSGHFKPSLAEANNFPKIFNSLGVKQDKAWLRITYETSESIDGTKTIQRKIKN